MYTRRRAAGRRQKLIDNFSPFLTYSGLSQSCVFEEEGRRVTTSVSKFCLRKRKIKTLFFQIEKNWNCIITLRTAAAATIASRAPGSNDDDDMFFTTPHVPWGKTRVGKASTRRSQEGVMRDLKYVVVSSPQENYVSWRYPWYERGLKRALFYVHIF